MVPITEANIISIDRDSEDDSWAIEGEITFEGDIIAPFSTLYYPADDEFEEFEMGIDLGALDKRRLKKLILKAAEEYEE